MFTIELAQSTWSYPDESYNTIGQSNHIIFP